ncbi:hypothetical protein [Colwellia echini]|uniref:Uncharacterized protein n=1 Tax=Colwellia echini TaxID=1982103 RepID=A0ABY3MUP3_9GAMM|nr:hypothetical protein [Colwellia echini]TYK64926.1 hypothetical protein CWS31_013245 [Colwellia echini]
MNFSTVELGLMVLSIMIIIAAISYYLGLRKTEAPVKAAALGFVFSVIPVLGIIYVLYLASKDDIIKTE